MGTTAYGGKGSKGRAANGNRPVGAASCRRDHHTMASCQNPKSHEVRGWGFVTVACERPQLSCVSDKRRDRSQVHSDSLATTSVCTTLCRIVVTA